MAMRLFSREEWREELQSRWKLTPTNATTATTEIWLTPKGRPVSVPLLEGEERIPDAILQLVEEQLTKLGEHPFAKPVAQPAETRPPRE
jgi:hypothetical protein